MRNSVGALTAVLAMLSLAVAAGPVLAASSDQATSQQVQSLEQSVNQWVGQRASLIHWNLTSIQDTLDSSQVNSGTVTATFGVTEEHLLAYASPADVPVMKGLQAAMSGTSALSANALKAGNAYIQMWQQQLENYITTPHEEDLTIKAQATLNPDGSVAPNSTQLFWLNAISGTWVPVSQLLAAVPTAAQVEQSSQAGMAAQLAAVQTTGAAPQSVSPQGVCNGSCYNWLNATNYANEWSSTPPSQDECPGSNDPNNLQNLSAYNPSYEHFDCTDCANYVSQALAAGGIPETSGWEPYVSAWVNVTSLQDYMVANNLWVKITNPSMAGAGAVITLNNDAHTMMLVYNDGTNEDVSAHTSDQSHNAYYGGDSPTYWGINY